MSTRELPTSYHHLRIVESALRHADTPQERFRSGDPGSASLRLLLLIVLLTWSPLIAWAVWAAAT